MTKTVPFWNAPKWASATFAALVTQLSSGRPVESLGGTTCCLFRSECMQMQVESCRTSKSVCRLNKRRSFRGGPGMKKTLLAFLLFSLGLTTTAHEGIAQSSDADAAADRTAPSYDMKAQSLLDLQQV